MFCLFKCKQNFYHNSNLPARQRTSRDHLVEALLRLVRACNDGKVVTQVTKAV